MTPNIQQAFDEFKQAKRNYECRKELFINTLPLDVQIEYHYNGLQGIKNIYPAYYDYMKELQ